jgi:hypothetical protein
MEGFQTTAEEALKMQALASQTPYGIPHFTKDEGHEI